MQIDRPIAIALILFIILWAYRNNKKLAGYFLPAYLLGYGFFRLLAEFFREPDQQIGYLFGFLTLGQLFSLVMVAIAGGLFFRKKIAGKSGFQNK